MFGFFYLGSRMQFVLFDLVVSHGNFIAPLWRLRPPSLIWRWIGIKLAFTSPLSLALLLPLLPVLYRLFPIFPQAFPTSRPGGPPAPPDPRVILALFSLYALVFAALAVLLFVSSLLSDFVLPSLALEDLPAGAALRRALDLMRSEPSPVLGFIAFQILLTIVAVVVQYVITSAASLLLGLPLALFAVLGYLLLHALVPPVLLVVGGVVLYLLFVGSMLYLQLAGLGVVMLFLRCYSLLFVGGRYPRLGDLLSPPPPPLPG